MADTPNGRVEFGHTHLNRTNVGVLFPHLYDDTVGDVFKQPGRAQHDACGDFVQGFVINRCAQAVAPGGFRKIGRDGDIHRVLVAYFLFLVVKAVVGKEFEAL